MALALSAACGSGDPGASEQTPETALAGGAPSATGGGGVKTDGGSAGKGGGSATGGMAGTGGTRASGGNQGTGGTLGSGGNQGTGGSKGTDGGQASPCSLLPGAGTWENISPVTATVGDTSGKNFMGAVLADPFDSATVWLGTGYAGFWKSTNCGAPGTWHEVSTGRNRASIEGGSLVSMALDPVLPGVIYVVPIYGPGGVWKSTNAGVDWDQLFPSSPVQGNAMNTIAMDPTNHLHLVVNMHANCNAPYAPTCEAESSDGGATWTFVKSPNGANPSGTGGGWEEGANVWILDASSWLYGGLHLWLTTDHGSTWRNLDPDPASAWGFSGDHSHTITRGADGTAYVGCNQGIVSSKDGWASWTLIPTGRTVGLVHGSNGRFYSSDQWSTTYRTASDSAPTVWSILPPPAALPAGQGAAFLDYDAAHTLLYSSNIAAGLWRVVVP
jgi:hypothetical protein